MAKHPVEFLMMTPSHLRSLLVIHTYIITPEESYQESKPHNLSAQCASFSELQLEYMRSEWISCRQSTLSEQGGCKYGRVLEQRENSGGRRCISTAATSQRVEYTDGVVVYISSGPRNLCFSAGAHKLYYVQMHRGRRCVFALIHTYK